MGAKQLKPQPERVKRIKEEKKRQGLTDQQIVDLALEKNEYTSRSSVYRVTTDGSENLGFRDATLLPIEKALGIKSDEEESADVTVEFYQRIIREQHAQIKRLRQMHAYKNVATAFLLLLFVSLLAVDRIVPSVGWYGTSMSAVWWIFAVMLFAFAGSIVAYHIHFGVHRRINAKENRSPEPDETNQP